MQGLWKMTCSILQIALPHTVSKAKADVYVVSVCRHGTSETESALLNVFRLRHFT